MKKWFLLISLICGLYAKNYEIKTYGFKLNDKGYDLIENQKNQCLWNICSLQIILTKGEKTFTNLQKEKAIQSYKNNLIFFPDLNLSLGNFENDRLNDKLNDISMEKSIQLLLQDKKMFLKQDKNNYYGKYFNSNLKVSYIDKDLIFFEYFVDFSYSSAAHPSFYQKGFAFDLKNKKIKTYFLKDVVKDGEKFRTFMRKKLQVYFKKANRDDFIHVDYFQKDEHSFNLLEQAVVFKKDRLYIDLRDLLSEADRSLDFFEIPYRDLKSFAKADLKKILN
ncbi:hypothetical protein [Campylobacter aviculae]|uniref:DUF3298 domain-containing protein n=1 Tax=Campylobacter aviculae TaxID=2510190 RepID=A0A4U7BVP2_9BACT|nr:hypothetical protein [Campylobacter aviculae]TKX32527.1 hypothetical protein CQA76_02590 [Campylobacter aviculae]